MTASFAELATEQYVSLTTFRRTGTPVATPVWLASEDGAIVVTTFANTGKVKRIRHTPRVTLQPCDARGRVRAGTSPVEGVAGIVEDPGEAERLARLVLRRYPVLGRVLPLLERLRSRRAGARVALLVRPA